MMRVDEVRAMLRAACSAETQASWAARHKMTAAYVSDVINGRREPGAKVLAALGLERVVLYRRQHRSGSA